MFDPSFTIADILSLILTIAATYIAVMEYRRSSRETKEEEERKKGIHSILNKLSSIDSLYDDFESFSNGVSTVYPHVRKMSPDNPSSWSNGQLQLAGMLLGRFHSNIEKALQNTETNKNGALKELYEILLQYEDRFSMSYGYNRYIEVMGGFFLAKDNLADLNKRLDAFIKKITSDEVIGPADMVDMLSECYKTTNEYLISLQKTAFAVNELKLKYPK